MNALYVTVSIPLLLVLAGFNHAHGLTTFGKSPSTNNQPPPASGKACGNHTSCRGISGTSCVPETRDPSRKSCLCGDNRAPVNGICSAERKGPHHLCSDTSQCVQGAECKPMSRNGNNEDKICECMPGYNAVNADCSGGTTSSILTGLIVLLVAATVTL